MVSVTFPFTVGQLSSGNAGSPATVTLSAPFSGFNISLGTLTGVSFSFVYRFQVSVSGPSGGGGFSTSGPLKLNGTPFTVGGTPSSVGTGGGGVFPGTVSGDLVSAAGGVTPDNALSTYLSPYTFGFSETTSLSVSNPSSYTDTVSDVNTTYVTALYTYAVPEPTSLSLLALGGVSALGLLYRRMSK